MSDVSYAVLTRAKAKYGKRLKEKDYKNLVNCETVAEVMTYLKNNTHYINAFGEASERDIHRDLFENLLHQYFNFEFDTISRYDLSVGAHFTKYIAKKTEINTLIRFLTLLKGNNHTYFNYTFPPHLDKITPINLSLLSKATTYDEFLLAIKSTSYEKKLRKYNLENISEIPITDIEDELYTELYNDLYNSINTTKGTEYEELLNFFDTILDYENFLRILRLKKYYHYSYDEIVKHLLPFGTLKSSQITEMCNAKNSNDVFRVMNNTKYGKLIDKINYTYAYEITSAVKLKKAKHNMYFSDNPTTVMMSYVILAELEITNLVTIIEGVRYNVDKHLITSLLRY